MKLLAILALRCLVTMLPAIGKAQPYTLTIFVNGGANSPSSVGQLSSGGLNFGHVFIGLTNGDKNIYLGYYGDPQNPARGQLRVDADLADSEYGWNFKTTFQITEQGYRAAHDMIDTWGTKVGSWKPWCNCSDFAGTVATVAGVKPDKLPPNEPINTPRSWAEYLRQHGGTVNFAGIWMCSVHPTSDGQVSSNIEHMWYKSQRLIGPPPDGKSLAYSLILFKCDTCVIGGDASSTVLVSADGTIRSADGKTVATLHGDRFGGSDTPCVHQ